MDVSWIIKKAELQKIDAFELWCWRRLLRVFSSTTIQKHQVLVHSFLYDPTLTSIHDYWKNHNLTIGTFVSKVMSRDFNMPPRLVIVFLPRSKYLLISWLQLLPAVILEPKKIKSVTASTFSSSVYHKVMGPDAMSFLFWMLSLNSFSTLPFYPHQEAFSFSSISDVSVVSSAYRRLLIFLPEILIPACASSSPEFYMMYSASLLSLDPK